MPALGRDLEFCLARAQRTGGAGAADVKMPPTHILTDARNNPLLCAVVLSPVLHLKGQVVGGVSTSATVVL